MQDLFELTPELLLEQSREMLSLCSAYENLFSNISSDLKGINGSWSDLLSHNFSAKISSAQRMFSGTLTMLRNSAESTRLVAEAAQEMDTSWASKIGGADTGAQTSKTQKLLDLLGGEISKENPFNADRKQYLELLQTLRDKYKDEMPPSIQAWIKYFGKKADKAFFDKNFGKIDDAIKCLEKLKEGDVGGAVKTGGKTVLKELFGEAVKGTAGEALNLCGYEYDPTLKYYINLGLGIGEGLCECMLDPSLENLTELAWNISVKPVLQTAGDSIETLSRLIPGISEYYYDENGAEDIGDAAAIALGDYYSLFSPDEDIREYGANYYKEGMWEGLWGGFGDIASFVKDSGGPIEAAKQFATTAWKDGKASVEHVEENAEYFFKALRGFLGLAKDPPLGEVIGGGPAFSPDWQEA